MIKYDDKNDILPVYNMRVAGELMVRGFVLKHTAPDKNGSRRNVFVFNNSPQIVEALNEIINKSN